MKLGEYNKLNIARETPIGLFLEDEDENEVLLPTKWIPEGASIGDEIEVFLYLDSEERLISTTLKPKITLNTFAYLQVKQASRIGAFLDWGLEKDLLVPFIEQDGRMQEGQKYLVYMYRDEMTDRLTASSKIFSYVEKEDIELKLQEEVELILAHSSDLGYNVIINNKYAGLLYESDVFGSIGTGDKVTGYIKNIRPDNKIDVSLQKEGYVNVEPNAQKILGLLKKHEGFLDLNDKSDPEEISRRLGMSKKTFKKSVGMLYRQKRIKIEENGIQLL